MYYCISYFKHFSVSAFSYSFQNSSHGRNHYPLTKEVLVPIASLDPALDIRFNG